MVALRQIRRELSAREFFATRKIPAVDALDPMVELLGQAAVSGEPVYPNGHPLANGYAAYARAAAQLLQLSF